MSSVGGHSALKFSDDCFGPKSAGRGFRKSSRCPLRTGGVSASVELDNALELKDVF